MNDIHADVFVTEGKVFISIHLAWDVYSGSFWDYMEDPRTQKMISETQTIYIRETGEILNDNLRQKIALYIHEIHHNPSGLAINNAETVKARNGMGIDKHTAKNRNKRNSKKGQGEQWI